MIKMTTKELHFETASQAYERGRAEVFEDVKKIMPDLIALKEYCKHNIEARDRLNRVLAELEKLK